MEKNDESYCEQDDKSLVLFFDLYDSMEKNAVKGGENVDKSNQENGFTIKINGQEKSFKERSASPIEEERTEAAAVESPDESFDWVLPNEIITAPNPKKKGKIHPYPQPRRPWKLKTPFILAIVAIVVGTSLGVLAIRTITAEQTVTPPIEVEEETPAVVPPAEQTSKGATVQTFLVQGGVFSTEEAAKEVQATLQAKKLPAEVFKMENEYYLFLGVAESLEATKELALEYKTQDVDVFWKEIRFKTKIAEDDAAVGVYSSLAELSAAKLRNTDSSVDLQQVTKQLNGVKLSGNKEGKERLIEASELLQKNQAGKAQEKLLLFLQTIVS
ncbi:hypothetical protein D1953_04780 [Peribacillus asahii]|uniref:SPOR domain-containing protein n=1 Tax=Peribacillus asahii TaxID=228899 RepID=A0A398BDZ7_9BACI|nr:hypothetical protein D1953_04780 [Peribacillus asahii]